MIDANDVQPMPPIEADTVEPDAGFWSHTTILHHIHAFRYAVSRICCVAGIYDYAFTTRLAG